MAERMRADVRDARGFRGGLKGSVQVAAESRQAGARLKHRAGAVSVLGPQFGGELRRQADRPAPVLALGVVLDPTAVLLALDGDRLAVLAEIGAVKPECL